MTPPLLLLALVSMDFARVFYSATVVANCARNGAVYASDPLASAISPYATVQAAALADAGNLSPSPSVSTTSGTDSSGNAYVDVTVSYTFDTIIAYPGFPSSTTITRMVQARVAPTTPN